MSTSTSPTNNKTSNRRPRRTTTTLPHEAPYSAYSAFLHSPAFTKAPAHPQTTPHTKPTLLTLPAELQSLIFRHVLYEPSNGIANIVMMRKLVCVSAAVRVRVAAVIRAYGHVQHYQYSYRWGLLDRY